MKKKNLIILISIIFIVCICISIFIITLPKNKYVCLNRKVKLGDIITEEDIKECITKNEIPEDAITEKEFFNFEKNKKYQYIGEEKNKESLIYKEDVKIYEEPVENKYVCLNRKVKLGDIITEEDIKECITKNEIPEDAITEKEFFNFEKNKKYQYIGEEKNKESLIYKKEVKIYEEPVENKYVCLKKEVKLGEIITEKDIKECTTKNEMPEDTITKKDFFDFEKDKEYIYIGVSKNSEEFLSYDDFSIEEKKMNLTNKLTIEGVMCPDDDINPEEIKYEIYINNKKLYAKNILTGVSTLIFDDEEVLYITERSYCCDGSANLLILTEKGNVYMSKEDMHYRDNCYEYDFSFINYNLKDVVSFEEYYIFGSLQVGKLYGIDKKGNSYLIEKEF